MNLDVGAPSASERLRELDRAAVPAPWDAEDDGVSLVPCVQNLAGNRQDRAVIAALRNALPLIADVVAAAERELATLAVPPPGRFPEEDKLRSAITALRDSLSAGSPSRSDTE